MSERQEHILLIDQDRIWAERFVNALQVRGWRISWSTHLDTVYSDTLYSVYLINLSMNDLDPRELCSHIRRLPKGENASIFLLNDGESPLKSFEEALSLGADGLYFHQSQMPLLLANFPPKTMENTRAPQRGDHHTLSSRHYGAGITLGGVDQGQLERPDRENTLSKSILAHDSLDLPAALKNQDRVTGLSLGHQNRQRLSQGYSTETGLSVSDIEAALNHADAQRKMGKDPTPNDLLSSSLSPMSLTPSPLTRTHLVGNATPFAVAQAELLTPVMTKTREESPSPKEGVQRLQSHGDRIYAPPSFPWGDDLSLSSRPFAEYFGHIISHRLSLSLSVEHSQTDQRQGEWCELVISEGEIVRLRSSDLQFSLITHLIASSQITQKEAEEAILTASRLHDSDPIDAFVESLIEIDPHLLDELDQAMEAAATKSLTRLFELSEGTLHISEYRRPDELRRFKLSGPSLLLKGIRDSMGKLRLYKAFGTPKAVPNMSPASLYLSHFSDQEIKLIQGAVGYRSISELAQDSGLKVSEALSLCYAFYTLGELDLTEDSPLKLFYERARTEDYYQLLSLSYEAHEGEILEAWRSHRTWLSEQRGDPNLVTPLIDIINDAYCVLAHAPLRVRYLNSLEKPLYSEMSIMPESYAPPHATRLPESQES